MASSTVRVKGLRETVRAFNKLDRGITRQLQKELKKEAQPVVSSAQAKIGRYQGARAASIGPRAAGGSVFVTQRAKKVTGQRPDFGALQMRRMLEALDENRDRVVDGIEDALDRFINANF